MDVRRGGGVVGSRGLGGFRSGVLVSYIFVFFVIGLRVLTGGLESWLLDVWGCF